MRSRVRANRRACTRACTRMHTRTYTHTRKHARADTCAFACVQAGARARMLVHARTGACTRTHVSTRAQAHARPLGSVNLERELAILQSVCHPNLVAFVGVAAGPDSDVSDSSGNRFRHARHITRARTQALGPIKNRFQPTGCRAWECLII